MYELLKRNNVDNKSNSTLINFNSISKKKQFEIIEHTIEFLCLI